MYRIILAAYSVVHLVLWPLVVARLWWRGRRQPAYRQRWSERWGLKFVQSDRPVIWVHAVSVGESVAAKPLIARLQARYPAHRILITTTTPTGSARVIADWGEQILHQYLPYDVGILVRRFLRAIRPEIAIFVETEIWPNYLYWLRRYGIPAALVNARLSARSARGYARVSCLVRPALARFSAILAAARPDARRFIRLGACQDSVAVCGNIKFDVTLPQSQIDTGRNWRQTGAADRPVLVLASSHTPEEAVLLSLIQSIRRQVTDVLVIWVPRHPERFDAVCQLCQNQSLRVARRSQLQPGDRLTEFDLLLGDSMGEMAMYYSMADVALVCGSLAPVGGHNPLEPIACDCAVVSGPHVFNFAAVFQALQKIDGVMVAPVDRLADCLVGLLKDPAQQALLRSRARRWLHANQGAADAMITALTKLLPTSETTILENRQKHGGSAHNQL